MSLGAVNRNQISRDTSTPATALPRIATYRRIEATDGPSYQVICQPAPGPRRALTEVLVTTDSW
ncbi:hypothetical protein GCM10027269_83960 [Kribbella endophytica]